MGGRRDDEATGKGRADPGRTLMHDPYEPHPWDEDGPPTGEQRTHGDTVHGSEPDDDSDPVIPIEGPPSFAEVESVEVEVETLSGPSKARAMLIGLLLGAAIGLAIVFVLARAAEAWR